VQAAGVEPTGLLVYSQRLAPRERLLGVATGSRTRAFRSHNPACTNRYTTATVPAEGVEPPAFWVWTRRSSVELHRRCVRRAGIEPSGASEASRLLHGSRGWTRTSTLTVNSRLPYLIGRRGNE
jgi:hypothetical protein